MVAGITTYTSDAAGNLLTSRNPSNQRTTNTWDFENRLTQVALPSGDRRTRSPTTATASGCRRSTRPARQSTSGTGRTSCWRQTEAISSRWFTRCRPMDLWQSDLAKTERDDGLLPVRWAGFHDATGEQLRVGDGQLFVRLLRERPDHRVDD